MREEIPWREYLHLKPRDLKKPEYRHLWLLLYWPLELAFFTISGRLPWTYHPIYSALDDQIPFLEGFVVPYELWFLCGFFIVLYTLRYDIPTFRKFMWFSIVTILVAGTTFLDYPTYFPGRPVDALGWPAPLAVYYEAMPRKNVFTWMMSYIYHTDPPRNAFPSEHVVVALGMVFAVLHSKKLRRPAFSIPFTALQLVICASVVYTKQHSVLDVLGALPVCLLGWLVCFLPRKKPGAENRTEKSRAE
jgi:membrane-associated phospholipid phosphatase